MEEEIQENKDKIAELDKLFKTLEEEATQVLESYEQSQVIIKGFKNFIVLAHLAQRASASWSVNFLHFHLLVLDTEQILTKFGRNVRQVVLYQIF